jgi:hypothetical protein
MASNIKKYLIVGHKFGDKKRGGYTVPSRFCQEHLDHCEFKEDKNFGSLKSIDLTNYKRLILWTQSPMCYSFPVDFIKLMKINHVIYIRDDWFSPLYNSCNNGFHYYRTYKKIKHFAPMITDFDVDNKSDEMCFGAYIRKWLTPDSRDCFLDILSSLKFKVKVCIMGDYDGEIMNHENVSVSRHTYDNKEFFRNVTHYFYPTSKVFQDPFPHSVLEAIQSGRQVIFPKIHRDHKDGIDDLKDCIQWHERFNPDSYLDNSNQPLIAKNFKEFYRKLFNNNFEYSFDRNRFKSMREWIEYEI